jgi:hypothetical protein
MTSLTVIATGKSALLRDFPFAITIDKPVDVAKVADVKAALAARFPKVRPCLQLLPGDLIDTRTALRRTTEAHPRGRFETTG